MIIKRQDKVDVSVHQYKTHNCTVERDIASSLMFSLLFGFSIKAHNVVWETFKT